MSDSPSPTPAPESQPPAQRRCGGCGARLAEDQTTCTYCGTHTDTSTVPASAFCEKCGYALSGLDAAGVCPECAHPVIESMRAHGVASPIFHAWVNAEPEIPTTVPDSALCRKCGYALAGLQVSDACPECGRPVSDSIRGDLLKFCDPTYLLALHRGAVLIEASIIISIVGGVGGVIIAAVAGATFGFNPEPLISLLSIIPTAMSVAGWMLLSLPDPGVNLEDKGDRPRKILRTAVVVSTVATLIAAVLNAISPSAANSFTPGSVTNPLTGSTILEVIAGITTIAAFVAFIVQYFACMKYLHWIAPRIPNYEVARQMKKQTWTIALLVFPGCFCLYLGPLVALVLFYNLLDKFRLDFKRIRLETTGSTELWKDLFPAREIGVNRNDPPGISRNDPPKKPPNAA